MDKSKKVVNVATEQWNRDRAGKGPFIVARSSPHVTGYVCKMSLAQTQEEAEARTNAIIATPKLLSACEEVEAYFESIGLPEGLAIRVILRAAINQARGEKPEGEQKGEQTRGDL